MKDLETRKKELLELVEKINSQGILEPNKFVFDYYYNGFLVYTYLRNKHTFVIKIKTKNRLSKNEYLNSLFSDNTLQEISYCKFSVIFKSKEIDSYTFDENN